MFVRPVEVVKLPDVRGDSGTLTRFHYLLTQCHSAAPSGGWLTFQCLLNLKDGHLKCIGVNEVAKVDRLFATLFLMRFSFWGAQ